MPRLAVRIALFLSSYAPLWGILAYRNRDVDVAWIVLGATAVLSVAVLMALLWGFRAASGPPMKVKHVRPRDAEVLSYIASYLIPFFGLDLENCEDLVTLAAFLLVLGVVYVNSSMLLVNPVLSLLGYRAWEITDSDDHVYLLLTRRVPKPSEVLKPMKVGEYVRLEVQ